MIKKLVAVLTCLMMVLSLFSCKYSENQDHLSSNDRSGSTDFNHDSTNDHIPPQSFEAEIAMKMYVAAIRDEIRVFDYQLGETSLKSLCFPSSNTRLEECKLLTKAILDMDQDGVNEYVIKSPNNEHIILRYYNGKVYSYRFDSNHFYNLSTDGTFYWHSSFATGEWEGGLNEIVFDGEAFSIKSIYSLKYPEKSKVDYYATDHYEFYINGEAVTSSEFLHFNRYKASMTFTPFEWTCSYPVTAEQAWNWANAYWNYVDGSADGAVGTLVVYKVVLLDTPNSDTNDYRIALQGEFFSNHDIRKDCNPPRDVRVYEQVLVNAFTGEVREYVEPAVDGKG